MTIQENIAATIRTAMAERDKSLVEFSKELGIGKTSLQSYLKADLNMRADTMEQVSQRLGITPAELVSGPTVPRMLREGEMPLHPLLRPLADDLIDLWDALLALSKELYRSKGDENDPG